jgi:predicted nucleotidyltransferase
VDILVEFEGPASLDGFMGLTEDLEQLLGVRVDLATPRSLRPSLLALVKKDLRDVA